MDSARIQREIQKTRKSLREKRTGDFVDKRKLRFSPAHEAHGRNIVRDATVEEIKCTLAGCYRFGVPFTTTFHYNVTHPKGVQMKLYDCLGNEKILRSNKYLNVFPNDYLKN